MLLIRVITMEAFIILLQRIQDFNWKKHFLKAIIQNVLPLIP